jgi:hypothetical protein
LNGLAPNRKSNLREAEVRRWVNFADRIEAPLLWQNHLSLLNPNADEPQPNRQARIKIVAFISGSKMFAEKAQI